MRIAAPQRKKKEFALCIHACAIKKLWCICQECVIQAYLDDFLKTWKRWGHIVTYILMNIYTHPDISIRGPVFLKEKKMDFKTNQKIPRRNSKRKLQNMVKRKWQRRNWKYSVKNTFLSVYNLAQKGDGVPGSSYDIDNKT
jgi:hypothetical protein